MIDSNQIPRVISRSFYFIVMAHVNCHFLQTLNFEKQSYLFIFRSRSTMGKGTKRNGQRRQPSVKEETMTGKMEVKRSCRLQKLVKYLEKSPGWNVKRKFEALAAFFVPFENGEGWNSTAGTDCGGRVSSSTHVIVSISFWAYSHLFCCFYTFLILVHLSNINP